MTLHEALQPNWSLHHPLILPLRGRSLLSQRSREHFKRPAKVCPILDTMPFFWSIQLSPESTESTTLPPGYGDLNMTHLTSKILMIARLPHQNMANNELSKWPILILDTNKAKKKHCRKQTPICHISISAIYGISAIPTSIESIDILIYIYMWLYMVVS